MNSFEAISEIELFASKLQKLGGLIVSKNGKYKEFVDLERFALDATTSVFNDSRLSRTIELWFYRYAKLLSVPTLIKLIEKGYIYNPSSLGALLSIADNKFPDSGELKKLASYCIKAQDIKMFKFFGDKKRSDPRWLKYGIIAPIFNLNEEDHFLLKDKKIATIPELKYRKQGFSVTASNILSMREIYPQMSLYRISKELNVTYAYVHRVSSQSPYKLQEVPIP